MKRQLIILHGALGSAKQFESLKDGLKEHFDVFTFNFDGHGTGKMIESMSIELFAENLHAFVQQNNLEKASVFGYSMGGYVALYLQSQQPELFQSILTLGTKFNWTVESSEKEVAMLNQERIKEKVPAFASYLSEIQSPMNWEIVMEQTKGLMLDLGNHPLLTDEVLKKVSIPVRICLGELDKMVSIEESIWAKESIPQAKFDIIDGIPHPIQQINPEKLIELIKA